MKKIFLILTLFFASQTWADMPPPPRMKKEQDKKWEEAKCKDPKNLILCDYSVPSPLPEDCRQYRGKPEKFKLIASNGGASFGQEKYCRVEGLDKASPSQK